MTPSIRYALSLLAGLLLYSSAHANAIDSLKTKEDVVKFLSAHFGKEYENYRLFRDDSEIIKTDTTLPAWQQELSTREALLEYRSNNFYKLDIDNDGRMDLLIDTRYSVAILDKGDKYVRFSFDHSYSTPSYSYKKAITLPDGATALLFSHKTGEWQSSSYYKVTIVTDTLVYKYNNIVEYNARPPHNNINKIEFINQPSCNGDCTSYAIGIDKNGYAMYDIQRRNMHNSDTSRRVYYQRIDTARWNALSGLLAYMDVQNLKSHYHFAASDQSTALLNVYFEDGSVKKISDYGYRGTVGLKSLYAEIFQLRTSPGWLSWSIAPPVIDSYLVTSRLAFSEEHQYEALRYNYRQADSGRHNVTERTFVNEDRYCGTLERIYITLFPDHHFVFTYPARSECRTLTYCSLGDWKNIDDSTIVLNWDGLRTLHTARNKAEYKKYLTEDIPPFPVRIENWRFTYSPAHDTLNPVISSAYDKSMYYFDK